MEAIILLSVIVVALLTFGAAAIQFGVDSREAIGDDHALFTTGGHH